MATELQAQATIDWAHGKWFSKKGKYSCEHTWELEGGAKLRVSDSRMMLLESSRGSL